MIYFVSSRELCANELQKLVSLSNYIATHCLFLAFPSSFSEKLAELEYHNAKELIHWF